MKHDIIKILSVTSDSITEEELELIQGLPMTYKDMILTEHLYGVISVEKTEGLEKIKEAMDENDCSYLRIEIV